ncbi:putative quinol monooxygenase [Pseudochelatococcus contaminans]|uniref:Quinol monooxygenase YgiN n=1 Tax=Pseudochelatococcus contaminans TaxID=1538103 RepID=A0A7W5Z2F3_9HYPH|nr:antibiotic biosynthesis monooxygenase [Pseudochelatococcus contaminans]MBB3808562.1 quinol monooxygenase YgiN [Pseudochelatococcus contaminans]
MSVQTFAQETSPAHVFNILPLKPGALETFLPVMQANAKASREEPGNISFDAFQGEDGSDQILLFESWKDRAAHNAHLELPHLKAVETRAATDFSGTPTSVWVIDVPGLPGHERPSIPDAGTTRNVIVRLNVKPEARDTFINGFAEVIPQARSAPGNYIFDLYQEAENPNGFVLLERWESAAAHEAHLGQPYSQKLDGIVPDTLAQPPERYLLRDVAP